MKQKSQAAFIAWRFYGVILFFLLLVAGLIARMVDLSVINRHFLQVQGDARALRVINTPAFRGMITDRDGYPLAISTSVYSVWINPKEFRVDSKNINELSKSLHLKYSVIQTLLQHHKTQGQGFAYVKRDISPEMAEKVRAYMIPGVYLQKDYKRYYPEGEIASQLVGFTNVDDQGQEGLELGYNQWLTGTLGKKQVIQDRLGRVISDVHTLQEQKKGNDLILSINRRIQYLVYRELMAGVQENIAKSGTVVVLDVKTGEILAMANFPSFNPNNRTAQSQDAIRNRAATDVFEPGSTIKPFSLMAVLKQGHFHPDTVIDTSPGWITVEHHVLHDEHDNGRLTMQQVLALSSQVGVTKMILTIQGIELWKMLNQAGFGEATDIGFPGERSGSLIKRDSWHPLALSTLAFGYGIEVTPLQLVQAYSILANDGVKLPLSLLRVDQAPKGVTVIDPKLAHQMLMMLETVVTTKGATGQRARVPGYRVAGKTGTAHIVGLHGYEKNRYVSSFLGIAPVSNPRLVIAVIVHDPQGKHYYGAEVSAPIFAKIMEGSLRILNIPPDDPNSLENKS